ncbi:unnamed protein product [Moneuplotes crassus]|uniref:Uncharacterized protein n=1 Tax=Euplotes crassus TaxID=5936 RepID=A0AAD1UI40_EUPCR|nr:unnamed protein product [Moneuplotes crassus]
MILANLNERSLMRKKSSMKRLAVQSYMVMLTSFVRALLKILSES